ncbi:MAG TPA: LacI family DNA-binding transcriptional regulator [Gaiellaceae bacterium]|nr:LacI family DNA-binding transcriptional regulator [Gaiellaceae bacterium]
MSSLRQVAARAGVSLATASRVASGSAAVRAETRERVESAMRELLYVPRHRAPATGAIGLLVPELGNPIFPALAEELERRAALAGFATILCNTAGSALREADYVHMLLERRVDGMIFISSEITDLRSHHSHYVRLVEDGARLVFVNGGSDELDVTSVGVDERAAGRLATEHLLSLGHRRIGFAAGAELFTPTRDKAYGRAEALEAAGLDPEPIVAYTSFTVDGGRAAFRALVDAPGGPPTGIICSNDLMAIGVIREAEAHGVRVPEDLSVVGFDGIEAARWNEPPLTTVEQPIEDIASTAVRALGALVTDGSRRQPNYVFRPRLRLGRSTAPLPGSAPSAAATSPKSAKRS